MTSSPWLLAQSAGRSLDVGGILLALGLLLVLVILGAIAIQITRRSMRRDDDATPGFGLQELRDLHAAGELSDEEFARARAAVIEKVRGSLADDVTESGEAELGVDEARKRNADSEGEETA